MNIRLIPFRALALAVFLSACATTPAGMTGPAFETAISEVKAETNPYAADSALTELLAQPILTGDQRAQALYQRGSLRRQSGDDRRGAVKDFEDMLALAPDHALAANAREEYAFAAADVTKIEQGLQRMLTLSQWFDSKWVLGDHAEAAARYQRAGLSPTPEQVTKLTQAGFLCADPGLERPVHNFGDAREDLDGLNWCREPGA